MFRLLAGLTAALLAAGAARAQDEKKTEAAEVDAKTKAAIQREVEKAKEEIRNEVRAEMQGAQSAAEFLGAVAEGPKLQFIQLDGYYRLRGQMMRDLDLGGSKDASGKTLFPLPLASSGGGTLSTANMRLRLEPTINPTEHVRVRAQIDVLDNYVLGSSTSRLFNDPSSPYPVPFFGASRAVLQNDPRTERPVISPKRVWAEVQTPVGLLSFGRMPSEWGLGILTTAGDGLDDDFGDTVDRIQFALPPVGTPIGRITFVPMLDFDAEGPLYTDPHFGGGLGQPFDAEQRDDARTWALKAARLDTEDEVRRKLERNERSFNFGAYYAYRSEQLVYPTWFTDGFLATAPGAAGYGPPVHTSAYGHYLDLWVRYLSPRWRVEAEAVGVYGNIGNAWAISVLPDVTGSSIQPLGRVLLRQWGGTIVTELKAIPNKITFGLDVGAASGDDAPGFGVGLSGLTPGSFARAPYGSLDGPQYGGGDNTIRNFRFNPAYRVDLVLFREILGQVTDAMYVKPKMRWDILPGLSLDVALIYSRALFAQSTPSASADSQGRYVSGSGDANLGIEGDGILTYTAARGFQAFGEWGILLPMKGLAFQGAKLDRAHFIAFGMAVKF